MQDNRKLPQRRKAKAVRQSLAMQLRAKALALRLWIRARFAKSLTPEHLEERKIINSFTNYERNQWARAGYPKGVTSLRMFKRENVA